jgi:hypothetical protein
VSPVGNFEKKNSLLPLTTYVHSQSPSVMFTVSYSSNKEFTQFIRFSLFLLSTWSLVITMTYDFIDPNWFIIFTLRYNAVIHSFVVVLGFWRNSSRNINALYFHQLMMDLVVFRTFVEVQPLFYRLGMAHRIILISCFIERWARLSKIFPSFEKFYFCVAIRYFHDIGCFLIWGIVFGFVFVVFVLIPAHLLIYDLRARVSPSPTLGFWCVWLLRVPVFYWMTNRINPEAEVRVYSQGATTEDRKAFEDGLFLMSNFLWKIPSDDDEARSSSVVYLPPSTSF